ncbi:hypothetical protein [Streptomyces tricolor]
MNAGSFPAWASVLDLSSVRVAACNCPPAHLKRTWADTGEPTRARTS